MIPKALVAASLQPIFLSLLAHGDALCTDDAAYQQLRALTRNPEWQADMLAKPLDERLALAADARAKSEHHKSSVAEEIMDVNRNAVESTILEHGVDVLLHGHTHRPAVHTIELDDHVATRIVLGDWYEQGSVLRWDVDGYELTTLPREP